MNARALIVTGVLLGAVSGCIRLGQVASSALPYPFTSWPQVLESLIPIIAAASLLVVAWAWIALLPLLGMTSMTRRVRSALFGFATWFLLGGCLLVCELLLVTSALVPSQVDRTLLIEDAVEALGYLAASAGFVWLTVGATPHKEMARPDMPSAT